ncbi:MAG: bifunctional aminoglycoside phosphotransferase/ATP-binding protein [Gammaproteobacteria bacterium]
MYHFVQILTPLVLECPAMSVSETDPLIQALAKPGVLDSPERDVEVMETHISWVLLAGDYAYKIKKPLDLGFLDFSTLEKRYRACLDELRLNRRLAPEIYLSVVPIFGSRDDPHLSGTGEPVEYAVKMRRFSQDRLLSTLLTKQQVTAELVDRLARKVADFHLSLPAAAPDSPWGTAEAVWEPVAQNFRQIESSPLGEEFSAELESLQCWSRTEYEARRPQIVQRRSDGWVRECHGDMHLGNMVADDGDVIIFDCIEFNAALRWIDTMSEVAFLVMDLTDRDAPELAARFLNRYLELTGDYAGLSVLRFYLVYRAMVRAKVNAIRFQQENAEEGSATEAKAEAANYLSLATRFIHPSRPFIALTYGLSGCGKTTYAQALLERTFALRIRSDVERKRLAGLLPEARSRSVLDQGIYQREMTEKTYRRLLELCEATVAAGWPVIVDATFLQEQQRAPFLALARSVDAPLVILEFTASTETLEQRIRRRDAEKSDASEATLEVLHEQQRRIEPLTTAERESSVRIDTEQQAADGEWIDEVLGRLGPRSRY